MTIVNISLTPQAGAMLADTLHVNSAGESVGFGSKVAVVPRWAAAVAVRGPACAHWAWARWWEDAESLPIAIGGAQEVAKMIVAQCRATRPEWASKSWSCEFLALWGHAGRVQALACLPDLDFRPVCLADGTHAFPWLPGFPCAPGMPLGAVVSQQLAEGRRLGISPDAGGDWILATVTPGSVSTRIVPAVDLEGVPPC